MSWYDPNNQKDQDPWSGKRKASGPPDLDKIIKDFFNKLGRFGQRQGGARGSANFSALPPLKHARAAVLLLLLILVVVWALSGIFIVAPAEESAILRFGRYQETVGPGPHWIPRFIATEHRLNTQTIYSFSLQANFLTKSSDQSDKPASIIDVSEVEKPIQTRAQQLSESDIDKNVVDVELNVQYRITDPKNFLFNIVDGQETLRQVTASVLSQVIGTMKLDSVLTVGRSELGDTVAKKVREILDAYQAGVSLVGVNVRKAQAPDEVADAFLEVAQAGQDGQRYRQQAEAYASKVVPLAQGNASRIKANAEAYKEQVILNAKGQIAKYQALLTVYKQAPAITRERMYLEAMENVLAHSSKLLLDARGNNNIFYLPLDKMIDAKNLTAAEGISTAVPDNDDNKAETNTADGNSSVRAALPAVEYFGRG